MHFLLSCFWQYCSEVRQRCVKASTTKASSGWWKRSPAPVKAVGAEAHGSSVFPQPPPLVLPSSVAVCHLLSSPLLFLFTNKVSSFC